MPLRESPDAARPARGESDAGKEVIRMALTRKDAAAAALTALAVLVFLATHEGWSVPLVGDSHRWAAGAIFLLGSLTCGLGSPDKDRATKLLAILGVTALALAVLAVATGSLTLLSLLVVDMVALWAVSTLRHTRHVPQTA
jgi:hypothetical protein